MRLFIFLLSAIVFTGCETNDTLTGVSEIDLTRPVAIGEVVTAEIKNTLNTIVRIDLLAPGTTSYLWDGNDQDANPVADGVYLIKIETDSDIQLGSGIFIVYKK